MELGLSMCFRFTHKVYNHVGIPLPEAIEPPDQPNQYDATVPDVGEGCLIFYTHREFPDCAHVGIQDGANIIDINCARGHTTGDLLDVRKHPQSDLRIPDDYADSQKKAPQELKDLDGE